MDLHTIQETGAEKISSFLEWANWRITKEMRDNKLLESEFGEGAHKKEVQLRYTDKERRKILKDIQGYLDEGFKVRTAAEKAGVHYKTYYSWKKSINNNKTEL